MRIKLEGREPDALRKVGLHYKLYNVRVSLWWTGSSTFIFFRLQVLYHIYLSSTYSRIKSRNHFSPGFFCFPHMPSSWFQLCLYGISYENSLRWKVSLLVLQNNCLILILPSFSRCPGPSCCPPPAGASRSNSFTEAPFAAGAVDHPNGKYKERPNWPRPGEKKPKSQVSFSATFQL